MSVRAIAIGMIAVFVLATLVNLYLVGQMVDDINRHRTTGEPYSELPTGGWFPTVWLRFVRSYRSTIPNGRLHICAHFALAIRIGVVIAIAVLLFGDLSWRVPAP